MSTAIINRKKRTPRRRLVAPSTVEHCECVAPPSDKRVQCAECRCTHNAGRVIRNAHIWLMEVQRDTPEMVAFLNRASDLARRSQINYTLRSLYCDHCNMVQTWSEICDRIGLLTGHVMQMPVIIRTTKHIESFLTRHPEATGVQQT